MECEDARKEWKISRMEWKAIFHASIAIPYRISCIVFTEKYIRMSGSDKYNDNNKSIKMFFDVCWPEFNILIVLRASGLKATSSEA